MNPAFRAFPLLCLLPSAAWSQAPVGTEFQVNAHTTANQAYPTVSADADGDFVVVWQSTGQDGSNYGVFGRRVTANGIPLGGEFQVNFYTTGSQFAPSVATSFPNAARAPRIAEPGRAASELAFSVQGHQQTHHPVVAFHSFRNTERLELRVVEPLCRFGDPPVVAGPEFS